MSSFTAQTLFTPEEYLALKRKATRKNEYLNGEILQCPVECELSLQDPYRRVPEIIS